jgi:hypothetical protein
MVTPMLVAALALATPTAFADSLFDQREYFQAAHEYHRVLFSAPPPPLRRRAEYGLGASYLEGRQFAKARRHLAEAMADPEVGPAAAIAYAKACIGAGDVATATHVLEGLAEDHDEAKIALGLEAAARSDWEAARTWFAAAHDARLAGLARTRARYRAPAPVLIAAASIIPGGGYLYIGRPAEAWGSLASTAALGGASWYYALRGEAPLAYATGALGLVFWGASAYGAVGDAAQRARRADRLAWEAMSERSAAAPTCPR